MTAAFRLARSARRDLQEISDFLTSEADEDLALAVIGGIIDTIVTLSQHPRAGVGASQFGEGVRKFPAGKYMVYYRAYSHRIEILHVFHGARDQAKAWRSETTRKSRG